MLNKMQTEGQSSDLKNKLLEIYNHESHKKLVDKMNDDEIIELAHNLKEGIPFATPVFDGAKENDITLLLEKSGATQTGQEILIDGITGEEFERPVTVGYIYMFKTSSFSR